MSVELVDAREDKQLWGEQYSRKWRTFIRSAGDCDCGFWESAGAAVDRRQDPFGEVVVKI